MSSPPDGPHASSRAPRPWARHPWRLPVLAGALLACSYYPLPLVVPNLVALVPLLVWIEANLDRPWRFWRNGGFVFGVTVNVLILSWMLSMLRISFLAIFAYVGLGLVFTLGQAFMIVAAAWTRRRTGWPWAALLPASWLSLEWIQAQGDLRITAHHLEQALGTVPFLIQFADLAGPYGVGLVLLVSNALLFEAWRGGGRRRLGALAAWALLAGAVVAYDGWAWTHAPQSSGSVRVSFIQPNIPLSVKQDPGKDEDQLRILATLTRRAAKDSPDIVIWPETARPAPIYRRPSQPASYAMPEVQALARELSVTIVTGAEYMVERPDGGDDAYNAVFLVHSDGRLDPVWSAKIVLVPFVEQIPFRPILGPILSRGRGWARWLAGGFSPGPEATPLPADGARLGVSVCYEELFYDRQRDLRNAGANVQAVITDDAWFGRAWFQPYQANADRLRAIENRSSFVRVANTGISMFVDPLGRDFDRTPLDVEAVRTRDVPLVDTRTLYDRIGNAVAYIALLALATAIGISWRREG